MHESAVTLLERAERDALEDLYRAAPPERAARTERVGGATVLLAPGLPAFFNRAFAFGLDEPVSEDGIDAVLAALRPASESYVQPPPGNAEIEGWLAARGLKTTWAWAKVMRGTEPPPDIATNLEIRELATDEADRFGAVVAMAFGLPDVMAPWCAALVGRPGWRADGAAHRRRDRAGLHVDRHRDRHPARPPQPLAGQHAALRLRHRLQATRLGEVASLRPCPTRC